MPRVSEAEKKKSHRRILDAAAKLMREKGIEKTSVSDVMSTAKLTHGGFYRHFESKETLATAAFQHAVNGIVEEIEKTPLGIKRTEALDIYIQRYLSDMHVGEDGVGCPLAAMATEAGRFDGNIKQAGASTVWRMAKLLTVVDGKQPQERVDQGLAKMALLLGTITLARLMDHQSDVKQILSAGRKGVAALKPDVFE